MKLKEKSKNLWKVLKQHPGDFVLWLMANLGGIIISSLAAFTILIVHNHPGGMFPSKEIFLITGIITLCVTGLSFMQSKNKKNGNRLPVFFPVTWLLFIILIYGFLIAIGVKKPIIPHFIICFIAGILFFLCFLWSSIIWLHEKGIESDSMSKAEKPDIDPKLNDAIVNLPKL